MERHKALRVLFRVYLCIIIVRAEKHIELNGTSETLQGVDIIMDTNRTLC